MFTQNGIFVPKNTMWPKPFLFIHIRTKQCLENSIHPWQHLPALSAAHNSQLDVLILDPHNRTKVRNSPVILWRKLFIGIGSWAVEPYCNLLCELLTSSNHASFNERSPSGKLSHFLILMYSGQLVWSMLLMHEHDF